MTHLKVLDQMEIATPCTADWNKMVGDDTKRFCGSCEKNVYDLTAMEEDAIFELIAESNGNFCGRLYKRTDGKVLIEDCPVGLKAKARAAMIRSWKYVAMAAATVTTLFFAAISFKSSAHEPEKNQPPEVEEPEEIHLLGKMMTVNEELLMGDISVETAEEPGEN